MTVDIDANTIALTGRHSIARRCVGLGQGLDQNATFRRAKNTLALFWFSATLAMSGFQMC
jgi:hypothetical protein